MGDLAEQFQAHNAHKERQLDNLECEFQDLGSGVDCCCVFFVFLTVHQFSLHAPNLASSLLIVKVAEHQVLFPAHTSANAH
jgi:hypothetical protein